MGNEQEIEERHYVFHYFSRNNPKEAVIDKCGKMLVVAHGIESALKEFYERTNDKFDVKIRDIEILRHTPL